MNALIVDVICKVRIFNDENFGVTFLLVSSSNLKGSDPGQQAE
jgi:hypothetical protein